MADKMEYYFKNPDKMAEIRQKGLEYVKDTSWEKEADKVKEVILQAIEEDKNEKQKII